MNMLAQEVFTTTLVLPNHSQPESKGLPYFGKGAALVFVLLAHAGIFLATMQSKIAPTPIETAKPITVSLIAAAPVLDITPVKPVEQPKKVAPPKPKVKIIPKPIKPIEKPVESAIQETVPELTETPQPTPDLTIKEEAAPKVVEAPAQVEEKIEPPKFGVAYLNNPAPEYPSLSKRAGEHGRVLLKVLVSIKGEAETVEIESSSGSERLDVAATNAVKRWRFVPARKGGQALSAYVLVPIKFSLDR
jgi:protein TonB